MRTTAHVAPWHTPKRHQGAARVHNDGLWLGGAADQKGQEMAPSRGDQGVGSGGEVVVVGGVFFLLLPLKPA